MICFAVFAVAHGWNKWRVFRRELNFDALAYEVSVQFIFSKPPFAITEEKFYCLAVCIIRSYILCVLSSHGRY